MKTYEINFNTQDQKNCIATIFDNLQECKNYIESELNRGDYGYFSDYTEIRIEERRKAPQKNKIIEIITPNN